MDSRRCSQDSGNTEAASKFMHALLPLWVTMAPGRDFGGLPPESLHKTPISGVVGDAASGTRRSRDPGISRLFCLSFEHLLRVPDSLQKRLELAPVHRLDCFLTRLRRTRETQGLAQARGAIRRDDAVVDRGVQQASERGERNPRRVSRQSARELFGEEALYLSPLDRAHGLVPDCRQDVEAQGRRVGRYCPWLRGGGNLL